MSSRAIATLLLFTFFVQYACIDAFKYLDCESFVGATAEQHCNAYKDEGCYWSRRLQECKSIHCWEFSSAAECSIFQNEYDCQWTLLPQLDTPICYENCAKLFDIVFVIDINDPSDAPKVLNYTKNMVSIMNSIYPSHDNNHFGVVLFSVINPVVVFDLNTPWTLHQLDEAFEADKLLFINNDPAKDETAINITKQVFDASTRSEMDAQDLRKLAIYLSPQSNYQIEQICGFTKAANYDDDHIDFYGAQIDHNGTFLCHEGEFRFVTDSIVSYADLYNDTDYLLSSLCPHSLSPTVSPTLDPTSNPTLSPTVQWHRVSISNKTCIDASNHEEFKFKMKYDGVVSGIALQYVSGWRKEDQLADTIASYWGSAVLNQFSVLVKDTASDYKLYPDPAGNTRGIVNCRSKYGAVSGLLEFYYCFHDDNITVNDTELILYAPTHTVSASTQWSLFYADDILEEFVQGTDLQNIGTICFAVNVLYDSFITPSPTLYPTHTPSKLPTLPPSVSPSLHPSTTPTWNPSSAPTLSPSVATTTTPYPTLLLTASPTMEPTLMQSSPTLEPTIPPTSAPSNQPSSSPTAQPSASPTSRSPTRPPSAAPTMSTTISSTSHGFEDCCEFFSTLRYASIGCDPEELEMMESFSDYLIEHESTCLTVANCGYPSYFAAHRQYNLCQEYWLNVVMFKAKCFLALDAYDVYSMDKACYLCNEYQVDYTNVQHPDGLCIAKQQAWDMEPSSTPTAVHQFTLNPSPAPTTLPSLAPSARTTTMSPTKSPIDPPTLAPIAGEEIIIDFQDDKVAKNKSAENSTGSTKKCANEQVVKCKKDSTLQSCLLVVFCTVMVTAVIMFIISCYYRQTYIKRDNQSYAGEGDLGGVVSATFSNLYRHFSDKSDIEDMKHKGNKSKKEEKQQSEKGKEKVQAKQVDEKQRQKEKERAKKKKEKQRQKRKAKEEKNEMKSKILAAISDSDNVELGALN